MEKFEEKFDRIASKIGLKGLDTLPALETARWYGRELDDADAADLGQLLLVSPLPNLKHLKLFGNVLGADGCAALAGILVSLPNLESVDLDNNAADDQEIQDASRTGNHIGDQGAEALAATLTACPIASLRTLNLGGNSIGDRGAVALARALPAQLTCCNLLRNNFSVEAAFQLARLVGARRGLRLCAGLSGLETDSEVAALVSSGLSDADGVLIAFSLFSCGPLPHVLELRLHDNLIGDATVSALAEALSGGALPSMTALILNNNCIGDAGFASLAKEMRPEGALAGLRRLGLRGNLLADRALPALASCLGPNSMPRLQQLLLGGNALTSDGLRELSAALRSTAAFGSLATLELQKNAIGDAGAAALAEALHEGALPQLRELYLFHNELSAEGEAAFANACAWRGAAAPFRVVTSLP